MRSLFEEKMANDSWGKDDTVPFSPNGKVLIDFDSDTVQELLSTKSTPFLGLDALLNKGNGKDNWADASGAKKQSK